MRRRKRSRISPLVSAAIAVGGIGAAVIAAAPVALAGPPYLTDDPVPVPYHHWEVYTFSTKDQTRDANAVQGPALEVNNGVAPNTQLHLVLPVAFSSQAGVSSRGLGDIEAGVKYRFLEQTRNRPDVGTFPMVEMPSGNANKGLGNGRAWFKLPLWIQKDWGAWTTYGGGGVALNSAPGQRDYGFGGWLLQRTLTPQLTLGGEVFVQGSPAEGDRSTALWNAGGQYNFTPDFSLLFTVGHSVTGEGHSLLYIGLYRTFGPGAP